MKRITAALLVSALLAAAAAPAFAGPAKHPENVKIIYDVAMKLVGKGDNGVIAMARVGKAVTYAEAKEFDKALNELKELDKEIKDREILFATNFLKVVFLKQSKKDKEYVLAELDKIIAAAKERRGQ